MAIHKDVFFEQNLEMMGVVDSEASDIKREPMMYGFSIHNEAAVEAMEADEELKSVDVCISTGQL